MVKQSIPFFKLREIKEENNKRKKFEFVFNHYVIMMSFINFELFSLWNGFYALEVVKIVSVIGFKNN